MTRVPVIDYKAPSRLQGTFSAPPNATQVRGPVHTPRGVPVVLFAEACPAPGLFLPPTLDPSSPPPPPAPAAPLGRLYSRPRPDLSAGLPDSPNFRPPAAAPLVSRLCPSPLLCLTYRICTPS